MLSRRLLIAITDPLMSRATRIRSWADDGLVIKRVIGVAEPGRERRRTGYQKEVLLHHSQSARRSVRSVKKGRQKELMAREKGVLEVV